MTKFVWAVNSKGELTKCTAREENIGKGRCDHVMHAKKNENNKELLERYNETKIYSRFVKDDDRNYVYVAVRDFGTDFPVILRKPKGDCIITKAQFFNRNTGKWQNDPDKWHKAVDMAEMSIVEMSPEEAMKSSLNLDDWSLKTIGKISELYHDGQVDKSGKPYYLHPQAVAEKCSTPITKAIALLHDTVEDTNMDEERLEILEIPKIISDRVLLLSKPKNIDYMEYVKKVSEDPVASEVKYYDLKHNTDLSRTNGKIIVSKEKWNNYQKALKLLNNKYNYE